jgi:hypothetical protein
MSYTPLTYQQTLMNMMQAGGISRTGKSMLSQWYGTMPKPKLKFTMRDQAEVEA